MKSVAFVVCLLVGQLSYAYFPENYQDSKEKFIKKTNELVRLYQNTQAGAIVVGEEKLTVDYFYIPAQEKTQKLISITSGNHGPEAYAGAALQHQFLDKTIKTIDFKNTGLILVHALNPWGFKYHRRGTENNVNLNRNFDISKKIFETPNDGYSKLKTTLEIREKVNSKAYPSLNLLKKMFFEVGVTQQSLTEAIGRGQYTSKTGINYGGNSFEPQTLKMIEILRPIVAEYSEIFHIDLHTGLGDNGILHIMTPPNMNEASTKKFNNIFKTKDDGDHYEVTPPGAKGFYEILGDYKDIISKIHPSGKEITLIGITAEFGTVGRGLYGKLKTINRLMLENQGHFAGYGNDKVKKEIQKDYLELFYPSEPRWRKDVLRKGNYLLDTIVKRFLLTK